MTLQVSTMFKQQILGTTSFPQIFAQGRILVYSGLQPATADAAVQGTLLGQITNNGAAWAIGASDGGLLFEQYGVWISKALAQTWQLVVSTSGTAGWFRLVGNANDTGAASYSVPRLDGTINNGGGADMVLSNTTLTAGQSISVQQFLYTIPPVLGASP